MASGREGLLVGERVRQDTIILTEQQYQQRIIDLAHLTGWKVSHFRPAQNSRGQWRTPVAADGTGFPDLVLARDAVLFWEIKTDTGRVSPAQKTWIALLTAAGAEARIIRPSDWEFVQQRLR